MNEKYLKDLYGWIGQKDNTFSTDVPFEKFVQKMQEESYAKQMHDWIISKDPTFRRDVPFDSFVEKVKTSGVPASWAGVPESAKFGGTSPTDIEELKKLKKKEQSATTELPVAASSSALQSQQKPKPKEDEGFLSKAKKALERSAEINYAFTAGIGEELLTFYDNAINATKAMLGGAEEAQLTPEQQKEKAFKQKFGISETKGESPFDPRVIISNAGRVASMIINSTIPQEQKNKLIQRLSMASNTVKIDIEKLKAFQEEKLPDNIPTKVVQGIVKMTPDLILAGAMENPAAVESRLAKITEQATKKAAPIVQKYAPKAAKVLEESIVAPFTKIMAVKEGVKEMAETKEGENPYWNAIEGSAKGALEGMYMHGLGKAAGKAAMPIAKGTSKLGVNSAVATAIAMPLANAGVFTTARALRTAATEGRMLTAEEAAMEAGTGIGFSLLHLGSIYKNQNEANHYYENILNDNEANSFSRVVNETKMNLDLAYNPELTPEQVKQLQEARDEVRKAILKEPDMQKKKLLGDEAIKIQNQLDAHNNVQYIVENRDFLIDQINNNDSYSADDKKYYARKIAAIAESYDMSEYAVKTREFNTKITEAQKELDAAGERFTNAKNPVARAEAKNEVDLKRKELEELNNQLTELITKKQEQDAIQKQESDESLLRAGEERLGLRQMGEGDTQLEITPEQEQAIAAEGEEEVVAVDTEFNKRMQEERAKRGLDRLFPIEIDETTPEGKQLAKEKAEQDQKVKELEEELKSAEAKQEETIPDDEYNGFIDKGVVSQERLNDIAQKVKNREKLSDRENEIFTDKTSEINKIISQAQPEGIEAKKADIERRRQEELDWEKRINAAKDGKELLEIIKKDFGKDSNAMSFGFSGAVLVPNQLNDAKRLAIRDLKDIERFFIKETNRKYDAELKALEAQPEGKVSEVEYKREDFPEYQANTQTKDTQKILDYFADLLGIEKYKGDLKSGDYMSWFKNALSEARGYKGSDDLGTLIFSFNSPRQMFDKISKFAEENNLKPEAKPEGIEEPKTKEERKSLSDKLRSLKSNQNYTYESVLGIPVAIWDGSIELIAKSIDAGVTVSQAIKRGINYIEKNHRGKWDKKQFNDKVIQHLTTSGIDINKEELEFRKEKENAEIINGFYSPLEQGLLNSKTEKTTGKEWVKKLEGLTEGDELKYTGMYDFLSENADNSLTKQELLDYMKNNRIQIKEITVSEEETAKKRFSGEKLELPGLSTNYKEILITLPSKKFATEKELLKKLNEFEDKQQKEIENIRSSIGLDKTKTKDYFFVINEEGEVVYLGKDKIDRDAWFDKNANNRDYDKINQTAPEGINTKEEYEKWFNPNSESLEKINYEIKNIENELNAPIKKEKAKFLSSHYKEENILAHLRMNTRTDVNGNKVLFIEEMQSDWGQKGREKGFTTKETIELDKKIAKLWDEEMDAEVALAKEMRRFREKNGPSSVIDAIAANDEGVREAWNNSRRINNERLGLVEKLPSKTPIASSPFVTETASWTKLAWKTALKEAVNQGVDKIAWTTGEQQNERYKLSNVVDKIIINKYKDGDYSVKGVKGKQSTFYQDGITEDKLSDYIGKELAQKAINEVKEKEQKTYEGEDLEIGGKGMKGFYGSPSEGKIGIIGEVIKSLTGQKPEIIKIGDVITLSKNFEIRENRRGMFNIYDLEKGPLPIFKDIPTRREAERMIEAPIKNESTQYSIDITPEIKESVKEGVSMFKGLSEAKSLADRVRSVKIGKGKAFDAILGIPVAIWDGSVELVAKSIEAGKSISEAIKSGVKYIKDNHKGKFNESEYADKIKDTLTPGYKDVMDKVQEYADFSTRNKEYWEKQVEQAKKSGNKEREKEAKAELAKYTEGNLEEAMKILEDSETYKNATDIEKEELVRDVESRFEIKQKKAPSPEELFGDVADANKVMEELNFLFDDANKSKDYLDQKYKEAKAALEKNPTSEKLRENVRKAKAEVEEYKTKNIDNAIAKLKESEIYKKANSDQQARMEKYLTDKFLKSQTSKILPTKLFGGAKDIKKVTITEKKRWADQLKAFVRGAKNTAEATKTMMTEIKSAISELSKGGSITAKQAETIINKMASLKVSNEKGITKFIDYVSKVFADAEYGSKITNANNLRSQISKLSGVEGKDANLVMLAKDFMKIKPSMVEDIDAYNEMAEKIKESLRGTKIGGKETPLKVAEMVKISEADKYIKEQLKAQEQKIYEEKLAEMNELFDTDFTGATLEQLLELAKSDKPIDKEKETIIRDAIKKMFDINSTIINSIIETGKDPFTGEEIKLSKEDINVVKRFMGMDVSRLSPKEAVEAIDKLSNFLQNGSTARMVAIIENYQGKLNAEELAAKGLKATALKFYGSEELGRNFTQQLATLPMMLETMFRGVKAASQFEDKSGIADLSNAKTLAQSKSIKMSNEYVDKFYERKANGKDFTDQSNIVERGMIADLKRTIPGTPEQQQAEFERNKKLIEQSIEELSNGTEKEKAVGKLYQEVYDKIVKDSKNIDDVLSKSDKVNKEAIDWWTEKWAEVYDQLADVSENVYNKLLDRDIFFTPKKLSKLFGKEDPLTAEEQEEMDKGSMFHNNSGQVYKTETGVLKKVNKDYTKLPENKKKEAKRYVDLSFDKNNVNSMYDALMDIHTSGVVRRIESFFNSPEINKIIPSKEDRNLLYNSDGNGSVQEFIRRTRGKEIIESTEISGLLRKLNTMSSIGVSSALGSLQNIAKQTVSVGVNTLINTGGSLDLGYRSSEKADFMDRIGYGISIRGLESQGQISSINKLIDLASKSNTDKALKLIDKAGRKWLQWCLANPDVFIAKASWISYYEKALKEQNIDPSTIDYKTHEVNREAANYAQRMVDRQQNISDTDLQGKLLGTKSVGKRSLIKMFMPFASFRLNQFMRAKSDLAVIRDKSATKEDKQIASSSLVGYGAEMLTYKLLVLGLTYGMGSLAYSLMGKKESDEEKNKRFNNLLRGQTTGTVTDVFSPIPTKIVDEAYAYTADKAINGLQYLFDVKDEDRFRLMTSSKEDALKFLGVYGVGIQKAKNLLEVEELARTGEFTDEYGRKKYISQSDKDALKPFALLSLLSAVNVLPADANTLTRNAIKFAKQDASSKKGGKSDEDILVDEMASEQRELNKEELRQERDMKASVLEELKQNVYDENKISIINKKIDEYLMTDEERKQYREDKKNERFYEKQRLEELLGEYDSKSDMKRYNPALYEERFGEQSQWYKEHKDEIEVEKMMNELIKKKKDEAQGYSGGEGGGFGEGSFGKGGFSEGTFGSKNNK